MRIPIIALLTLWLIQVNRNLAWILESQRRLKIQHHTKTDDKRAIESATMKSFICNSTHQVPNEAHEYQSAHGMKKYHSSPLEIDKAHTNIRLQWTAKSFQFPFFPHPTAGYRQWISTPSCNRSSSLHVSAPAHSPQPLLSSTRVNDSSVFVFTRVIWHPRRRREAKTDVDSV